MKVVEDVQPRQKPTAPSFASQFLVGMCSFFHSQKQVRIAKKKRALTERVGSGERESENTPHLASMASFETGAEPGGVPRDLAHSESWETPQDEVVESGTAASAHPRQRQKSVAARAADALGLGDPLWLGEDADWSSIPIRFGDDGGERLHVTSDDPHHGRHEVAPLQTTATAARAESDESSDAKTLEVPMKSAAVDRAEARREMLAIYTAHSPEKLAGVETLLDKYLGRESELLARLRRKYGEPADTGASDNGRHPRHERPRMSAWRAVSSFGLAVGVGAVAFIAVERRDHQCATEKASEMARGSSMVGRHDGSAGGATSRDAGAITTDVVARSDASNGSTTESSTQEAFSSSSPQPPRTSASNVFRQGADYCGDCRQPGGHSDVSRPFGRSRDDKIELIDELRPEEFPHQRSVPGAGSSDGDGGRKDLLDTWEREVPPRPPPAPLLAPLSCAKKHAALEQVCLIQTILQCTTPTALRTAKA